METVMLIILTSGMVAFIFGVGQAIGIGYDVGFSDVPVLVGGVAALVASLVWFWGYSHGGAEEKEETDDNQE